MHGPAGIGKTALALAAAARVCETGGAERSVYLSLASGADAAWVVDSLGLLLVGPEFTSLPRDRRLLALYKAAATQQTVMIWDHADRALRSPWASAGTTLRPILELGVELTQTGRTRLLVVGRQGDLDYVPYQPSRRVEVVGVGPLDAASAEEMAAAAGAGPSAGEVAAASAGNPLAVRLLSAAGAPPADAAPGRDPLELAFDRFWSSLSDAERRGLSAAAALHDGASEEVWSFVTGGAPGLDALERAGLASGDPLAGAERYLAFPDGLHALLAPRADALALEEGRERHRQRYMELAYEWSGGESPAYPGLVLRELPNLLLAFARSVGDDQDLVAALTDTLQELLGAPPRGAPTMIQRVLSAAETLGVRPVSLAS